MADAVNRTALLPGRTWGAARRLPFSILCAARNVDEHPQEGIRESPAVPPFNAAMMSPSSPQLAPTAGPGAGHSVAGEPPCTATFLSLPSAKTPIDWPSGEKNGVVAPSVPESSAN